MTTGYENVASKGDEIISKYCTIKHDRSGFRCLTWQNTNIVKMARINEQLSVG